MTDTSSQLTGPTLVLGGIRSGKSRFAESLLPTDRPVRYLATGQANPGDDAWTQRIAAHRARRPAQWVTTETTDVVGVLRTCDIIPTLLDDIGGWLTATLDARHAWELPAGTINDDIADLLDALDGFDEKLVIVSPEVGSSVVPATASGRLFADELGLLNQQVARRCDRVLQVVAGQPVAVKGSL